MRNTDISALIILAVTIVLVVMAGVAYDAKNLTPFTGCTVLLLSWIVYVWLTSFYRITPDKMLASVFIGTMGEVYANRNFAQQQERGKPGLFSLDIALLLYPLWYGVFFPTTTIKLVLHATTVYLKEYKIGEDVKSPGVPVRVDMTILLWLKPDLGQFVQAINVLSRGEYDLAHETTIKDNLWEAGDERNERYEYSSPRIAQLVLDTVSETVLHSVRSVASQKYTWKELPGEGGEDGTGQLIPYDIKGSIPYFIKEVMEDLARPESVFVEAGIFEPVPVNSKEAVRLGPAARKFDLRVEDVTPEDDRFAQALHDPMIADLQRDADKLRGIGEGDRLKQKSERSGVSAETIVQSETLQGVNEVKVYGAGDKLTDLVKKILGGGE